jgi:hypothetical protein
MKVGTEISVISDYDDENTGTSTSWEMSESLQLTYVNANFHMFFNNVQYT